MVSKEEDKGVVIEDEPLPVSSEDEDTITYRQTFNLHFNENSKKSPKNNEIFNSGNF